MDELLSAERLSWLVGLIYDSAIDKAQWPIAMEAIRTELDFSNSTLNLQLFRSGEVVLNVTSNIPEQYLGIMLAAGPDVVEQWGGEEVLRAWPMNEPAVLRQVNPSFDPATSTNGYYLRFANRRVLSTCWQSAWHAILTHLDQLPSVVMRVPGRSVSARSLSRAY